MSIRRAQLSEINFQRTYLLGEEFEGIRERAFQILEKYQDYPDLIKFDESDRSVTFSTERLIPSVSTNRPRDMLLIANPHPYSVHQGMFFSPNTIGLENLFWPVMEDAGWRFHKQFRQFRKASLNSIRAAISQSLKAAK